ncbi:toxin-antitoxin system YwqK family antitoxin [Parapedobacter tibetensis]|uniref:toxin-antitoxin system YwqK family antitoxin n=1 Tax=Parapedobacter tibetensis TaxID=2972951 RepID=UPI00214D181C|nr:hypothetical protein [Parapedobacter tibetensis]
MKRRYTLSLFQHVGLFILLIACSSACQQAYGQRYLEEAIPFRNEALLQTADGFIDVTFTHKEYRGTADPQTTYHSYYRDSIYHTQGGYHGHPLHGAYVERYPDKSLKVLGAYAYGLRTGKWQYWDNNGVLRKVSRWRDGKESGKFALYNEAGQLQQRGRLRDGNFDGIIKTVYQGDSSKVQSDKRRFHKGKEMAMDEGGWLGRMYDRVRALF